MDATHHIPQARRGRRGTPANPIENKVSVKCFNLKKKDILSDAQLQKKMSSGKVEMMVYDGVNCHKSVVCIWNHDITFLACCMLAF